MGEHGQLILNLSRGALLLSDLVQAIRGLHVEVTSFTREDPSDLIGQFNICHLDES